MKFMLRLLLLIAPFVWGTLAQAEVYVTSKHLVILRSGIDAVWGSYVFAVNNKGEAPESLKVHIMMPAEMQDFYPQEGVSKEEVQLSDSGLSVEKEFPPGVTVISIGFRTGAKFGKATISFTPYMDIDSFTLLMPRDSGMQITAKELVLGDDDSRPDPQYVPYISNSVLRTGETFTINVSGIPEGRLTLWITGGISGGVLLLAGLFFAFRTRPRVTDLAAVG